MQSYITRVANKRILAKYFLLAYKSIISIGNLEPVGRFSLAMPHFIVNYIHLLEEELKDKLF